MNDHNVVDASGKALRIAGYAVATVLVVFVLDRVLTGEWSGFVWSLIKGIGSVFGFAGSSAGGVLDAITTKLGTMSWRPFLIVTGAVGLFCALSMRGMPPGSTRRIVDFVGTTSALLFLFMGSLYGLKLFFDSWKTAQNVMGAIALFLLLAWIKKR